MKHKQYNQKRIAFAGGSTGGHVVPISTLIKEMISRSLDFAPLRSGGQDLQVFWFGERGSLEERECEKLNYVHFIPIVSGKLRRKPNFKEFLQNGIDLFTFIFGIFISLFYLLTYRIDSIFSKGGFVSLPVVIAGWILRIPIVVHESDSKAGISTKIAAIFANKIFTGFPGVLKGGEYVGQILSAELVPVVAHGNASDHENVSDLESNIMDRVRSLDSEAMDSNPRFGMTDRSTILVNCGSLGSASVHEALLALFKNNPALTEQFHRIILLGKLNAGFASDYSQYPDIERYDYIDQKKMGELYMKADISICRGGSTTLVEQHSFGIKQIIVPIPWTHDQATNAVFFVKEYGDSMLDQNKKDRIDELGNKLNTLKDYMKGELDMGKVSKELSKGRERIIEYIFSIDNNR